MKMLMNMMNMIKKTTRKVIEMRSIILGVVPKSAGKVQEDGEVTKPSWWRAWLPSLPPQLPCRLPFPPQLPPLPWLPLLSPLLDGCCWSKAP